MEHVINREKKTFPGSVADIEGIENPIEFGDQNCSGLPKWNKRCNSI